MEYYHRYVACQIVLCRIPVVLDIEAVLPGEGETIAAARLLRRMLREQPRMVDVFTFDALYADANALNILNDAGKWWVVVLKQEARDAYDEINRLLPLTTPSQHTLNGADITLWDIPQMTCWDTLSAPFRAVISEEKKVARSPQRRAQKRKVHRDIPLAMAHQPARSLPRRRRPPLRPWPLGHRKPRLQRTCQFLPL